jgi:hypothetical protein
MTDQPETPLAQAKHYATEGDQRVARQMSLIAEL